MMKKTISALAAAVMLCGALSGCGGSSSSSGSESQAQTTTATTAAQAEPEADAGQVQGSDELYMTKQEVRPSPEWVTKLDAAKDSEQMIVIAGVDKSTAYITMHEKDESGKWQQLIATPGFIGLEGLGDANIEQTLTPVGTFTVDKAFGLADDPGCQMEYTKVDDSYYWSGDAREGMHFNELVSVNDVPDLNTEESEHIADFDAAYQYVLNMGYNSECVEKKGFGFFLHYFRINRPYTGGCAAVPENIMKFIMQHVKPGCRVTINSLKKFGGDLDA